MMPLINQLLNAMRREYDRSTFLFAPQSIDDASRVTFRLVHARFVYNPSRNV